MLIALAADSWWEGQKEQARARTYQAALETDVAAAQSTVMSALDSTAHYPATTDSFLSLLRSRAPLPEESKQIPVFFATVSIPTGTLDALIETGDINLLRDNALRASIIAARAEISVARRLQAIASDAVSGNRLRRLLRYASAR